MKILIRLGLVFTQSFDAQTGTEIEYDGYIFKVHESDDHHIQYLEVKKV